MTRLDRSLIAGAPAFAGLPPEALDQILARAETLRAEKGEIVFRQGDVAERFFLLLHGRLRVTRINAEGAQMLVRFIAPQDMFGIAMAIGAAHFPGTATAAVESVMLAWPNAVWRQFLLDYPGLGATALQAVGARLLDAQDRALDLASQNVEQRIAGAVLKLVRQAGKPTDEGMLIDFPLSRQDLAEMAGATLHTVSRTLSAWEAEGVVACGRQRVAVRDEARLAAIAGGQAPAK